MSVFSQLMMRNREYLTCSIVGTPTINGNIVTDISSSDYIRYATADILSGHNWQICLKVWWDGATNGCIYLRVADGASYLKIETNGGYTFNGYDTSNAGWYVHSTNFPKNKEGWYYISVKYEKDTGTIRTLYGTTSDNLTVAKSSAKGEGVELRYLNSSRYIYSNANAGNGKIDIGGSWVQIESKKKWLKLP